MSRVHAAKAPGIVGSEWKPPSWPSHCTSVESMGAQDDGASQFIWAFMWLRLPAETVMGFIWRGEESHSSGHFVQHTRVLKPGQGLGQQFKSIA